MNRELSTEPTAWDSDDYASRSWPVRHVTGEGW